MLGKGFEVVLTTLTDEDFINALGYYQTISTRVADRFYEATLIRLADLPLFWAYEKGPLGLRKMPIGRFPYYIVYAVDERAKQIVVEGIMHGRSLRFTKR